MLYEVECACLFQDFSPFFLQFGSSSGMEVDVNGIDVNPEVFGSSSSYSE